MSSSGPELITNPVVFPNTVSPPPPPVYPGNHPQVILSPGYQTQIILPSEQEPMVQKIWKEGKVLGAIQILIGLIHIGFGIVLLFPLVDGYIAISFVGGYPFWGGISFIASGSLSVSAQEVRVNPCKIYGSLGMNIVSAIFSSVGIIIFIAELVINSRNNYIFNNCTSYGVSSGIGISSMLFIFSILEFIITCLSSNSGCHVISSRTNQVAIFATAPPF